MPYSEDELKEILNSAVDPSLDSEKKPDTGMVRRGNARIGFTASELRRRRDNTGELKKLSIPQTSTVSSSRQREVASGDVASYDVSHEKNFNRITKEDSLEKESSFDTGNPEIYVNFDFDDNYPDLPEDSPIRLRRERRTGCIGGVLYAGLLLSVSLLLAALLWMGAVDVLGFGTDDEAINLTIHEGIELEDLLDILYGADIIKYRFLFEWYAEFSNAMDKIYPGTYVLNKNYDYRAIVQGLTRRTGARLETTVLIPEGLTLAQIFIILEDHDVAMTEDLWETAKYHNFDFSFLEGIPLYDRLRLEGFLFPDTYNFFVNSTPTQVLIRLLREFDRRFTEEMTQRAEQLGYTVREIIIIASLIEREAGSDDERPRIAAVIYNRLNNWNPPRLEIDATIHYAIAGTDIPFSTQLDSAYNTYTHAGLPPGPISNPGIASIMAALYPDNTDEYFYALNLEGTHNFFTNFADHDAFVNSPEYGG